MKKQRLYKVTFKSGEDYYTKATDSEQAKLLALRYAVVIKKSKARLLKTMSGRIASCEIISK